MSESMDEDRLREAFGRYFKPRLLSQLHAIGIDKIYHRGAGDSLFLRDEEGRETCVLDLLGGFGANLFGHNHPELVDRLRELLDAGRPFNAQASMRASAAELAERLSERIGRSTGREYVVTFANSGAEAVEAAVKHAELAATGRMEQVLAELAEAIKRVRVGLRSGTVSVPPDLLDHGARLLGIPLLGGLDELFARVQRRALDVADQEPRFLVIEGAFHGKTTGSLMMTYNPEYRGGFTRIGLRTVFLPPGDEGALAAAIAGARTSLLRLAFGEGGVLKLEERSMVNISACFVEPIQGEGGIREMPRAYLAALRAAADEAGFPLVIDEIQSGMGRTGTFLASEQSGVRGDYYLLSKSLGGGLVKISALAVDRAENVPEFGYVHTSTFADDDFSCAVALKALDLLERNDGALLRDCRDKGEYLLARLRALQARFPGELRDVRGRGLMIGFELAPQPGSPSPLLRVLGEQNLIGFLASGYLLNEERIRVAPTLSAHGTIRVEPSAYISTSDLDRFCDALERLLVALRDGDAYRLTRFLVGRRGVDAPGHPERPRPRRAKATLQGRGTARVVFLAHFLEPDDLTRWEPSLAPFRTEECRRFLERTHRLLDPFVVDRMDIRSITGDQVNATVVALPFTPELALSAMREGSSWALDLVRAGVETARRLGGSVVGFGGYTSIVSDNCRAIVEDQLALTSGNALTAAAAIEALFLAARRLRIGRTRLGVVGAAGNIGTVLAEVAADEVDEILLVGRPGAARRLEQAAAQIRQRSRAHVEIGTDMEALRTCRLIITTTNAPRPVILPAHVAEGPVVICDVAQPRDVAPSVKKERPEAVVLKGGMIRLPLGQRIDIEAMDLEPGQVYGCLAETLLLGLARIREHFSYGSLTADHLRHVRDLARYHGFTIDEHAVLD